MYIELRWKKTYACRLATAVSIIIIGSKKPKPITSKEADEIITCHSLRTVVSCLARAVIAERERKRCDEVKGL